MLKRPNILFDRIDTSPEDFYLLCWWMNDLERLDKEENTEHSLVNKEKRTFLVQYCDDFYLLSSVNFFHFLCRSLCPRLPDFCLSPSSRLSTTMHHCTVLDKCNLCDNILSNDTNLKKHRMKYHKGYPF